VGYSIEHVALRHIDEIGDVNVRQACRRHLPYVGLGLLQGVPLNNVIARGLGKLQPIASNTTPGGRKMNRRVELVVTGTAIGRQQGGPPTGFRPQQPQK
jgi:hypothetical protein